MTYTKEELLSELNRLASNYDSLSREYFGGDYPSDYTYYDRFGSIAKAAGKADVVPSGYKKCEQCGSVYKHISRHYNSSDCNFPEINHDIVTGMLLGDGSISRREATNSYLLVTMINEKFVRWLSNEIPSGSVRINQTAEQSAKYNKDRDFCDVVNEENYHDLWRVQSISHPDLNKYRDWYSPDKKYPENLTLTPEIVRMWYCCDGGLHWRDSAQPRAMIISTKEKDRAEYLEGLFSEVGFDPTFSSESLWFTVDETKELLSWMGNSPPGFSYKWEIDSLDRYKKFKYEQR